MSTRTFQSLDSDSLPASADGAGASQSFIDGFSPALLSVGEQLRAAREGRGASIADVAFLLKLSPRQVEALEADDWDNLPCTTIIRGFVRNYARAFHLDQAALMAALDAIAMPAAPELHMPAPTNARVPVERGVARRDYVRVLAGGVVLAAAVLAYFFFPQDALQSAVSTVKSSLASLSGKKAPAGAPLAEKAPEVAIAAPATALVNEPAAASAAATIVDPALASAPPPTAAAAPAAAAENALKFSFREASWVEVRDRSGEIIFKQLSQPGTQREITGKAPFSLIVGNASHVSLSYKGKPIDLSKRSKDEVARVTVE